MMFMRPNRRACLALAAAGALGASPCSATTDPAAITEPALPPTPAGTPQDFDFEHGRWHTALRRRLHPLSGSDEWADYTGTTTVRALMGGLANVVELDVSGRAGRIQGLSLRLFDTRRQRWTLNFASLATGTLSTPMSGGFGGGPRGVFYSSEDFKGRPVLVRFVIEPTGRDRCRFEQAFSADGGRTWESNWIAVDTRNN
jgi:hypothetical protein